MRQGCFGQETGVLLPGTARGRGPGGVPASLPAEDGVPELLELAADAVAQLPVALGCRSDPQRPQQLSCRTAGITCLAEDGMQPLGGEMVEHQVHDAPRIECLVMLLGWHYGIESRTQ